MTLVGNPVCTRYRLLSVFGEEDAIIYKNIKNNTSMCLW